MGLLKDILILSTYFLLLSTVLQTEDAWVEYYESENPPPSTPPSRARQMFIFSIFALLYYFTLLFAPFLKSSTKNLALTAAAIILLKYIAELLTFSKILINIFQLTAIFLDVIGQALFYLTTIRLIQLICEKHNSIQKSGQCLCVFPFLYALSITLGYALAEPMFRSLPAWLFLIALTSLTAVALVIAYFSFRFQPVAPSSELHEEQPHPEASSPPAISNPTNNNQIRPQAAPAADQNLAHIQIYRQGLQLKDILRITFALYSKTILIIPVQLQLGILLAYTPQLLQYLVWTTQTESVSNRLNHNMLVMIIYGVGAAFSSALTGALTDIFSIRRVGYAVIIFASIVLSLLYLALNIKYFYTTFLLYMFLGMATFSLYTWIICVCSKTYGGKFEIFAVNAQIIGVAFTGYTISTILFGSAIKISLRLGVELATQIIGTLMTLGFVKKIPAGKIDIQFEETTTNTTQSSPASPVQNETVNEQKGVQIQMTAQTKRIQKQLQEQPKMNAELLL